MLPGMADDAKDTMHGGAIGWGILLAVVAFLLWLGWTQLQTEIRDAIRWLRVGEVWLIAQVVGEDHLAWWRGEQYPIGGVLATAPDTPAEALTGDYLSYYTAMAMGPLRTPLTVLFGALALWCLFRGPKTGYRRTLGLEGLIRQQAPNFGVISPIRDFDPSTQPPRPPGSPVPAELPPFAEALGPEEWLAYHTIPVPDGQVDLAAAEKAFARQLGPPWRGAGRLAPEKMVLLAAFCLKAARKRAEADDMLARLARCWTLKKGLRLDRKLVAEARRALRNADLVGATLKKVNQHGFEATALLRALATARAEGGVLAPAQFVWLRAHDRNLWYPLDNLGRQTHHMEALGAMAHYRVEKMTARPIPVPKVAEAARAIAEYMASAKARPIPALDYSKSKKRGIKKAG